jgi:hypothetical protein
MLGNVWDWTGTTLGPYPGFAAGPYKKYLAPWFGDHKVCGAAAWRHSKMMVIDPPTSARRAGITVGLGRAHHVRVLFSYSIACNYYIKLESRLFELRPLEEDLPFPGFSFLLTHRPAWVILLS